MKGGNFNMGTILEEANNYEPKTYKSIVDEKSVSTNLVLESEERTGQDGEPYTVQFYQNSDGEKVRVPTSVLGALKEILKEKPHLKAFKVKSTGTGMTTKYTVVPLD